jgi:hypothetical protein
VDDKNKREMYSDICLGEKKKKKKTKNKKNISKYLFIVYYNNDKWEACIHQ